MKKLIHLLAIAFAALCFAAPLLAAEGTVAPGKRVILSVTYDGGTPPVTFQWHKDGQDIPGATAQTLVLYPVTPADAGTYTVTVKNDAGSTLSDNATLIVIVAPSNAKTHSETKDGPP